MATPSTRRDERPRAAPSYEVLLRGLLEGSADAAAVYDVAQRAVGVNWAYGEALREAFGVAVELGGSLARWGALTADGGQMAAQIAIATRGTPTSREIEASSGGAQGLVSDAFPLRSASGEVCGVLHVLRESSRGRRRGEAGAGAGETTGGERGASRLRLGRALEAATRVSDEDAADRFRLFVWDAGVSDLTWTGPLDAVAKAPMGKAPRGEVPRERVHPEDTRRLAERVQVWQREGRVAVHFDYRTLTADGRERWREAWARLLPPHDGVAGGLAGIDLDVTALVTAERNEQASRAAYERVFEVSLEGIVVHGLGEGGFGPINRVNPAFAAMVGRPVAEVAGRSLADFAPLKEQARVHEAAAALRREGALRHDLTLCNAAGERVEIEASSRSFDEAGRVGVISVLRDVTKRKAAEADLARSEAKFRALTDALPQIVWTTDKAGMVDYTNRNWSQYTGADPTKALGQSWVGFVHPDDRERSVEAWARAIAERGTYEIEARMRRGDGTYRWFLHRGYPAEPRGAPAGAAGGQSDAAAWWLGTSTDIHALKEAEKALRERERWMRAIVETVPHMVWTADPELGVEFQSRQLMDYVGAEAGLGGRFPWGDLVHPDDAERARALCGRLLATRQGGHDELRLKRRDGVYRWFTVAAEPLMKPEDGSVRWIGTWTDIDERKGAEEQLRESGRRKEEFLAVLSHELRNPLAPIHNSMSVLERAPPTSPTWRRAVEIVHSQLGQLTRLVDDLLDMTRINSGKLRLQFESVDLTATAARGVEDHRDEFARRGVALLLEVPAGPVHVRGDGVRLSQVLGNLLQNTMKFTPRGGTARVRVGVEGDHAVLTVSDDGIGIEAELLQRLFEPFMQADPGLARSAGGLGLGLALVRGIVQLHGGTVEARSEGKGRGASFVVRLATMRRGDAPARGEGATRTERRRVLIVEDNRDSAESLQTLLEFEGHEARVASSGVEGVREALSWRPDVVLCDIGLPEMNGYDVARALRAEASLTGARLVALSGYATPEDARRAREAGFAALLAKPATLEQITQEIAASRP